LTAQCIPRYIAELTAQCIPRYIAELTVQCIPRYIAELTVQCIPRYMAEFKLFFLSFSAKHARLRVKLVDTRSELCARVLRHIYPRTVVSVSYVC
jgi:hypothetical protein